MRPSLPSTSGFTAPGVIIYKGHSENSVSEGRVTFSTILGTPLWSSVERPWEVRRDPTVGHPRLLSGTRPRAVWLSEHGS